MNKILEKFRSRLSLGEWLLALAVVVIMVLIAWPSVSTLITVDPNPTFQELRHKIDRVDVVDILFVAEGGEVEERVVASLSQEDELDYFFKNVVMVPFRYGVVERCRCHGNPHLKFYAGDQLIDSFSVQHGSGVRMGNHYGTDIGLKGVSQNYLQNWFKELKVTGYYQREDQTGEADEVDE